MFISLILKGGPVMIPIILGSIVALAIILERAWTLWKIRLDFAQFSQEVFLHLERGHTQKALESCEKVRHPISDVFKLGILNRMLKREELESLLEREGNEQIQYLEKYLGALLILIGIEPMLGFLGTITGLIRAFMAWEPNWATASSIPRDRCARAVTRDTLNPFVPVPPSSGMCSQNWRRAASPD